MTGGGGGRHSWVRSCVLGAGGPFQGKFQVCVKGGIWGPGLPNLVRMAGGRKPLSTCLSPGSGFVKCN